jgi:hypothetical protein
MVMVSRLSVQTNIAGRHVFIQTLMITQARLSQTMLAHLAAWTRKIFVSSNYPVLPFPRLAAIVLADSITSRGFPQRQVIHPYHHLRFNLALQTLSSLQ